MASIIDSTKLVFSDSSAIFKLLAMSFYPYATYALYKGELILPKDYQIPTMALLLLLYLGFFVQILNNSIKETTYVMSNLNPFMQLWVGIKTVLSCSIFFVVPFAAVAITLSHLGLAGMEYNAALIILATIAASFSITSLILFSKKLNILDGLNLFKIAKNFHEIIVYILLSLAMLFVYNIITGAPLGLLVWTLFGYSKLFDYTICFILTFNLAVYFQSLSHAYYEQIHE